MKAPIEVQFAQKLAANEPGMRNKAVKKLRKWFSSRQEPFSDAEMMRLWKGLYYCFWMSDKSLVQEELAENISSFVSCFKSQESSLLFIKSFLLTMGREWVGIDRWRTEKFMMLTRRFLRSAFKFLSASSWDQSLVEETVSVFRENVILCVPPKTSLDFQLHFIDVFLEELAKVAGQNLETKLLDIFLGPFIEIVRQSDEARLRDHVGERIFRHLLRQSDPGIKWQNEEFEDDEAESGNEELNGEDAGDDEEAESEEEAELVAPEDPRAGGVHAVIPQLAVDYQCLSVRMFEAGSEEGLKNSNRQALYELSKMFKDVAQDVFPLGPNIEDDEQIPKIKEKKEIQKLMKATEKARELNQKEKMEFKKALKIKENSEAEAENGVKESNGVNGHVDSDEDEDMAPVESDESNNEESKASSKELKKKRKREQKRRKKERLMKEASDNELKDKISKDMVDQDIQRVNTVSNLEHKEKKFQEKRSKVKEIEEKKKKKKKSAEKSEDFPVKTEREVVAVLEVNGDDSSESGTKKKKTKKKKNANDSVEDVVMQQVESTTQLEQKNDTILQPTMATLESFEKIKKKKEKKKDKKPLYRIDSDIAFNAPTLSKTNLTKLDEQTPEELPAKPPSVEQSITQSITAVSEPEAKPTKKKKLKKYNAESSLLIEESETPIMTVKPTALPFVTEQPETEQSATKEKKKKKKKKLSEEAGSGPGASPKSSKMFEEDNCWGELEPGETELVIPNKKYKGDVKLAPSQEVQSPMVTPAKTFTSTFLKKAMSKSEKKGEKKKVLAASLCMSEPRKKKVNVVLTKNSVQDFGQHLKSVKNSPQTPHDPNKNPAKSALKRTPNGPDSPASKGLNPVQLNTQLNGRSSTAKKLAGKNRKRAADFF